MYLFCVCACVYSPPCHAKLKPNDLYTVKVQQSSCIYSHWHKVDNWFEFYENHENLYLAICIVGIDKKKAHIEKFMEEVT